MTLWAKNFTQEQISSYINSRDEIINAVNDKASNQVASRNLSPPTVFTFNDTVIIALKTDSENEYNTIKGFAKIIRRFISYSFTKNLFFRGAFSIGSFILSKEQHLIMGNAVTDAASWYAQPQFIGAVATPKASMIIKKHVVQDNDPLISYFLRLRLFARKVARSFLPLTGPKHSMFQDCDRENATSGQELVLLLDLLSASEVPFGTEDKYNNTIDFFKTAPIHES